jgi:hypothetical protein
MEEEKQIHLEQNVMGISSEFMSFFLWPGNLWSGTSVYSLLYMGSRIGLATNTKAWIQHFLK